MIVNLGQCVFVFLELLLQFFDMRVGVVEHYFEAGSLGRVVACQAH